MRPRTVSQASVSATSVAARLGHQHQPAAVERVGHDAADHREDDDRDDADQADERRARGPSGPAARAARRARGCAADCMIEPVNETSRPIQSSRKLRWRSAGAAAQRGRVTRGSQSDDCTNGANGQAYAGRHVPGKSSEVAEEADFTWSNEGNEDARGEPRRVGLARQRPFAAVGVREQQAQVEPVENALAPLRGVLVKTMTRVCSRAPGARRPRCPGRGEPRTDELCLPV